MLSDTTQQMPPAITFIDRQSKSKHLIERFNFLSLINADDQVKVVFMLGLAGEDSNEDVEQEEERNRW